MKWKKILTGTLAAAMLFSNASVTNLNVLAKETAVVSLESARETLGTLMNEAIEKVNIEKDGIKYSQASKDAVMVKYAAARKVKNNSGATEEQVEAAIKDLREALDNLEQLCKVTVDKRFTNDIKVTLTAEHAEYASENEDSAEFYVPLKEKVTVTTSEKDGNIPFSGWEMTVNNGGSSEDSGTKIVSNSTVYTFYVTGETHLEPVYGETDEKPAEEKGPEISVATTKAYSAQLAAMYCLAVQFAKVRGKISEEQYSYYISEMLTIPDKMQKVLEDKERIQWFASKYANAHDVFFVGRGIDYAVCLEGSLKLKEISYIHSEAYAAGELKHGTISLIEQGTLVIGVLTQSELYEKTISNMLECKSRGAYLMGLTTYGKYEIEDQVNFTVYVPKVDEHFVGSLAVVPLQLIGYYVSVAKGLDVDKPRNLAKSVTVE